MTFDQPLRRVIVSNFFSFNVSKLTFNAFKPAFCNSGKLLSNVMPLVVIAILLTRSSWLKQSAQQRWEHQSRYKNGGFRGSRITIKYTLTDDILQVLMHSRFTSCKTYFSHSVIDEQFSEMKSFVSGEKMRSRRQRNTIFWHAVATCCSHTNKNKYRIGKLKNMYEEIMISLRTS